jgi:hypothetical protein
MSKVKVGGFGVSLDGFSAGIDLFFQRLRLVELRGIEPLTSAVRLQRSPI